MAYINCEGCGGSNKATSTTCYNCERPLEAQVLRESAALLQNGADQPVRPQGVGLATITFLLSVSLTTMLGALIGFGFSVLDFELPFFLEEIALGVICAVGAAFCIGKFQDMPDGLLYTRLGPAGALGGVVGLCLFGIWWSFDPSAGFPVIGAIAGFCSSIPICVSFGLAGGESRPLGGPELMNVVVSLGVGFLIGLWFCFEVGETDYVPGAMGILGLIPTFFGARVNLVDIGHMMDSSDGDSDLW